MNNTVKLLVKNYTSVDPKYKLALRYAFNKHCYALPPDILGSLASSSRSFRQAFRQSSRPQGLPRTLRSRTLAKWSFCDVYWRGCVICDVRVWKVFLRTPSPRLPLARCTVLIGSGGCMHAPSCTHAARDANCGINHTHTHTCATWKHAQASDKNVPLLPDIHAIWCYFRQAFRPSSRPQGLPGTLRSRTLAKLLSDGAAVRLVGLRWGCCGAAVGRWNIETYACIWIHMHTYAYMHILHMLHKCSYAHMHIYTSMQTYADMHTDANTCTHIVICTYAHMHRYTHAHMHTYAHRCTQMHTDAHICTHAQICTHAHICLYA